MPGNNRTDEKRQPNAEENKGNCRFNTKTNRQGSRVKSKHCVQGISEAGEPSPCFFIYVILAGGIKTGGWQDK